jgi:hypothetical protein
LAGHQKKCRRAGGWLLFLDESGFSLTPYVAKTWAPRGATPVLRHCFNWPKLSAISAVSLGGRCYFRLRRGTIGSRQLIAFLRQLLRRTRRPLFVLWDGVQFHRAKAVEQFLASHRRLHVFRFPPYCPDLNPDEYF